MKLEHKGLKPLDYDLINHKRQAFLGENFQVIF